MCAKQAHFFATCFIARVGISFTGLLASPSLLSFALDYGITIKHLLQGHEESICLCDLSGHQDARACGVA